MTAFGAGALEPPLVLGSVFGRRLWNWNSSLQVLESPIKSTRWEDGSLEAYCYTGSRGGIDNSTIWKRVISSFIPPGAVVDFYDTMADTGGTEALEVGKWSFKYIIFWRAFFKDPEEYLEFKNSGVSIYKADMEWDNGIMLSGHTVAYEKEINKRLKDAGARKHTFQAECACGFYAYFGGHANEYFNSGLTQVSGIIEGTGETVVGTRGFRSSKARIVALAPMEGYVGDKHWYGLGRSAPKYQTNYSIVPTVELLEEKYPDVAVYPDTESMYAVVKTSSVLDFE